MFSPFLHGTGRATEWFNTAKEIPKIITRIKDVIQKLINSVIHRRSLADEMENTFNNGVKSMVCEARVGTIILLLLLLLISSLLILSLLLLLVEVVVVVVVVVVILLH